MKIKLTTGLAGPAVSYAPGDVFDAPADEAARLIAAGYAVPFAAQLIERAVATPARETRDPLDHDGDGRRGGSLPKAKRKPKEG